MDESLSEVNRLTEKFLELKQKIEDIEENQISPLNKEIATIQGKLISLLETNKLKKFSGTLGSVLLVVEKKVDMPKGDDKFTFVEFMKNIGEWDTMASIHHSTLNSWFKQKMENDSMFLAPGLGLPKENKYLKRGK